MQAAGKKNWNSVKHDQSKDSLVKSRHLAKIMKFEWKIPEAWLIKILRLLQLMGYYI